MASLFTELKRRNVFRVAVAYLVVAWVALEVAEILIPIMKLPDWTLAMVLFVAIVGFPFAVVFAWAFELTPDGVKRAEEVLPGEENKGTTLNKVVIGLLSVAVLLLLADRLLVEQTTEDAVAEGEAATVDEPKSIAVLPFTNMSNDPEQDYFSDGISEEILVGLAYFDDLQVAARTSAFSFKGKDADIKEIGETLDVDTVLEGSVRKAGQRLRITAQLINVEDGYHLWSGTFDRELTDIFAIQDEISAAILSALRVHLVDDEVANESTVVDFEAYNYYLKGKENLRPRTRQSLELAVEQFQKAIDIEPDFADAWAGLGFAYGLSSTYGNMPAKESSDLMREATARALSLDPDQWLANAIHGRILMADGNAWGAIESIERAIAINPSESELYTRRLFALNSLGRFREARASAEQAYRLDPLHTVTRSNYVGLLVKRGEFDKARELTPRNTVEAWELEAEIATQEHRWLDLVDVLKQGIAASEGGENTFLSGILADTYLFTFMAPELAKETEPSAFERFWIDAPANPAAYLPALSADEMAVNARAQDIGRIILLIALGNCEDIVAIQDRQEYLQGPVYGYLPSDTGSVVDQLLTYAWCLGEVGRTEDSNRLAQRIQGYFDASEINGAPPIHYDQAVVARILGDDDAATRHLRAAWENNDIGWFQLEAHWWDGLREREDFQAIKQALWERMNTLRAGIGLDPATPYQPTLDRMAGQSEAQTAPAT